MRGPSGVLVVHDEWMDVSASAVELGMVERQVVVRVLEDL